MADSETPQPPSPGDPINPGDPTPIPEDGLDVGSGCGPTGRPFVELRWQDKGAQISPDAARDLAQTLLQAASASEADAMLLRFFRTNGFPDGAWQAVLTEWREYAKSEGQ